MLLSRWFLLIAAPSILCLQCRLMCGRLPPDSPTSSTHTFVWWVGVRVPRRDDLGGDHQLVGILHNPTRYAAQTAWAP